MALLGRLGRRVSPSPVPRMRYPLSCRRLPLAFIIALTASCGGDGPSEPSGPAFATYAGTWSGTTSQNRTITLWVGSTGVIDSLRVQIRIDLVPGLSSCIVTFRPTAIQIGNDLSFAAPIELGSYSGTLAGSFATTSTSSGTFEAGWEDVAACGSSVVFGSGGQEENGTWNATKS